VACDNNRTVESSVFYAVYVEVIYPEPTGEIGSCEPGVIQQGHEHGSRRIPIVGTRYLATPDEDIEDFNVWNSGV
jgi:hypothetical protein